MTPGGLLLFLGYAVFAAAVVLAVRRTPVIEAPATRTGWWAPWMSSVGVAVCAVLLFYLHRHGGIYFEFIALVPLAAAITFVRHDHLAALGLGVAVGSGGFMAADVVAVLGIRFLDEDSRGTLALTVLVSAALLGFALVEIGRRGELVFARPDPYAATVAVLGVGLLVWAQFVDAYGGYLLAIQLTSGWSLVFPLVAAVLTGAVLVVAGRVGSAVALGAALGYLGAALLSGFPTDEWRAYSNVMLVGHVVLLAAVVTAVVRRTRKGEAADREPQPATPTQ
ncbi:MAG: hypothetical protein ACRDT4_16835 [Micromonosporaceae bacterium]